MKQSRDEVAESLHTLTETIEERRRQKEAARKEKKEREIKRKKQQLFERLVAPVLFVATLIVSAIVMALFSR
jgi:hypothetical protein